MMLCGVPLRPPRMHRCSTVLPQRVPIPESLYSIETGDPISTCLVCDRSLLDGSTEYLIEKGYRQYEAFEVEETVFGYALCVDCHTDMRQSFSDRSRRRCRAYLSERINLGARTASLPKADDPDPSAWTRRCIVHDTPKEELQEYQLLAHCHGTDMLLSHFPLLIGGPAVDELTEHLSNETIDELGGLRDEHLGPPPELERDLQGPVLA